MLRIALGNIIAKYHKIRFLPDSDTAQPVITKHLISLINGGRFYHLFYSNALTRIMQCIRTTGLLAYHTLLYACKRIGRICNRVITCRGYRNSGIKEGLHRKLIFSTFFAQNSDHHFKIFRFEIKPVGICGSYNIQFSHTGDIRPVYHLKMGYGIPVIMRSCLLQRFLYGI